MPLGRLICSQLGSHASDYMNLAYPDDSTLLTDMLHTLGKVLIAEGVETEQQLEMVKSVGIERVQGFYYAKPIEEQAFLEMVG